ncbi:MAG: SDR family NAD(P)-dependent oxidoreductase [Myxococcota bacterium]|nr:SDR family NAD(P)-dependent oxidoreductase [Myxococcota bacterium]
MRALVTGGAGFIGSHLADALLEAGYAVRVLDALAPQVHGADAARPAYLSPEVELCCGDVRDRAAVRDALVDVDVVIHAAAAVGVGQSMYQIEHYVETNCRGSAVLLEEVLARRERIRRLVVPSSMSVYGEGAGRTRAGRVVHPELRSDAQLAARRWDAEDADGHPLEPVATREDAPLRPGSVYAVTKRDQEEMFLNVGRSYGIPTVALRYFNAYGSRQSLSNPYTGVLAIFCARLLNQRAPVLFEDGLQTRDFVHVSDVVRATLLALESPHSGGRVYNVGSGQATSVREIARLLAVQLGLEVQPQVSQRHRAGDIRHCHADLQRIRDELGYAPAVDLASGIDELLAGVRTGSATDGVEQATQELEARGLYSR